MWKIEKIVSKGDYDYAVVFKHPTATKHGYVLEHRIVIENSLGRLLNPKEVAHHKNGDRKDNRLENLKVMKRKEHCSKHGLKQGRLWVVLKCPECAKIFEKPKNKSFLQQGTSYTTCSPQCRGRFSRKMQLQGITIELERAISGNLVSKYRKYSTTIPSKPLTMGCVEAIRPQSGMAKRWSSQQA